MKNNILHIIFIMSLICFPEIIYSQSFIFESKNIEILNEGSQINSYNGKAVSEDKNLELSSDKFIYLKNSDVLKSYGNGKAYIKSEKVKINFDEAIFYQKKLKFEAKGNIEISQEDTGYIIESEKILYDQKNNIVTSDKTTKIEDNQKNTYYVDSFIYEINKNLIKVKNLSSQDINLNTFKTSVAYINTKTKNIFGKDIKLSLSDSNSDNSNDFKLFGNSGKIDENKSEINKGVFTSCKKRDGCPPWQLSAKKIKHDKKKREISYQDAVLKLYDVPVAYFPKFFHPDPTVKRKTGFLIPSIQNSTNSNNYLNMPFFYAIAENKDFTFSPRLYAEQKILLQTEFRQKNLDSYHNADLSLFHEKNKNSKNHFFYEYDKNSLLKNFETSQLNLKIQTTSNDKYLKTEKLKGDLIEDNDIMENSLNLDLYSNNLSINVNSTIYEDLNKKNNDRYEYILPKVRLSKNFDNLGNLKGNINITSDATIRHYNTNIQEKYVINDLIFNSYPKTNKFGFLNNHEILLRNNNSENKNSNYKNKKHFFLSGIYQYNSSLPLIKEDDDFQNILKPKISLRIAPTHTKDDRTEERKIDLTNIYSIDRITDGSSIEGGMSLVYGVDYSYMNKSKSSEILSLKFANNLRFEENKDIPKINQMGDKMSNIFSEISINPNNFSTIKYISSLKNNFENINYENLISEFKVNNLITTFDYLNENNTIEKNSYLTNTTSYSLDSSNSLFFSTRKNKTKDLTEYYNFMYQYKNDCLAASIEYNKDFYSDSELKPEENILFKLTITPFAEVTSPSIY